MIANWIETDRHSKLVLVFHVDNTLGI